MIDVPEITDADLRDDAKLTAWLEMRYAWCGLPPSRHLMSRGIACADRAIANGHEPCRLFAYLIDQGMRDGWQLLTADQIAAAEKRLVEMPMQEVG